MNNESIEIIRDTLKPDRDLIERAKNYAMTEKKSGIHIPALIAACFLVIICSLFFVTKSHNGDFVSTVPVSETTEEKELFYSELVPHQSLTENQIRGNVLLSVAPFSELYLKECIAIIEGEILSVRTKEYTVIYEFDKFEKGGRLTSETETLIIEIRADKIWYGDIKEGERITVETEMFKMPVPAVGRKYVLPLCDEGEEIRLDEAGQKYLSGDIKRESIYSIVYPFHPQIEKTEKGYLFTSDWEGLVTEKTKNVTLDISLTAQEEYYTDKMKLNTEDVFQEQFTKLLFEVGLTS